jgi:hypothetical protein
MKKIILFAGIVAVIAIVAYVLLATPPQSDPDDMDDDNYWSQFDDPVLALPDVNVDFVPPDREITIEVSNLLTVPQNCEYNEINSRNSLYNIWFTTPNAKKYSEYNCAFPKGAIVVLSVTELPGNDEAEDYLGFMTDYGQNPEAEKIGDESAQDNDGTLFFRKGSRVFSLFRSTDGEDNSLIATNEQLLFLAKQIARTN